MSLIRALLEKGTDAAFYSANSPQNSFSMLIIQPAGRSIDYVWVVNKDLRIPWLNDQQEYIG